MMTFRFCAGIILVCILNVFNYTAVCDDIIDESFVVVLTKDNFETETRVGLVLVEFYAPWCGHCKALAPEYEKAAKILKDAHSELAVTLAKVDATEEAELAKRFEVEGYPTLKVFRDGQLLNEDFNGRDSDEIVAFMRRLSDPDYKPPPETVITLSTSNFSNFVNNEELVLVEFYAPWCGHCKKLAPEYEKASQELIKHSQDTGENIRLAKVDATSEKDLAEQYKVEGFPTLKIFRKGKVAEYLGPREARGIVDYMKRQYGDAAQLVGSLKQLKARISDNDITVLGLFASTETTAYERYQEACNNFREDFVFLYTTDEAVRKKYNVNGDAVIVIAAERFVSKYEEPFYKLDIISETNVGDIVGFFHKHSVPLVGERTQQNQSKRYTMRPLCVLYVSVDWSHSYKDMTDSWRRRLLPIAQTFKKDITFALSDDERMEGELHSFGLDDSGSQFNMGCFGISGDKYPLPELDEWDAEEVTEFLNTVKNGKAKPYLKSQIPPKKQSGPVVVVVGKTFKEIVLDESKDVLIEMYAPWCGHCKAFEPKYAQLAKELASEKDRITVAKMDATANDSPPAYNVQGYPTIYLALREQKDNPIKYEGNREPADIKKFLKDNGAGAKREKPAKEEL